MLKVGPNYLCPTGVARTETPCPTKSINAQELLQVAVAHIIDRVINPQTLEQVSSIIQDEYGAKACRSQENLARAEATIAAMNALKNQAVHNVEHHDRPYSEVAQEWCIPKVSAEFVAHMEDVLDLYAQPYDPRRPVVCFDETSTQLLAETRAPMPPRPGRPQRQDYEYRREGTRNLFLACEPLAGGRWR